MKRIPTAVALSLVIVASVTAATRSRDARTVLALQKKACAIKSFRYRVESKIRRAVRVKGKPVRYLEPFVKKIEMSWRLPHCAHIVTDSKYGRKESILGFGAYWKYSPKKKKATYYNLTQYQKDAPPEERFYLIMRHAEIGNSVFYFLRLDPKTAKITETRVEDGIKLYVIQGRSYPSFVPAYNTTRSAELNFVVGEDGFPRHCGGSKKADISEKIVSQLEINPELPDSTFKFEPPKGVKVEDATEQWSAMDKMLSEMMGKYAGKTKMKTNLPPLLKKWVTSVPVPTSGDAASRAFPDGSVEILKKCIETMRRSPHTAKFHVVHPTERGKKMAEGAIFPILRETKGILYWRSLKEWRIERTDMIQSAVMQKGKTVKRPARQSYRMALNMGGERIVENRSHHGKTTVFTRNELSPEVAALDVLSGHFRGDLPPVLVLRNLPKIYKWKNMGIVMHKHDMVVRLVGTVNDMKAYWDACRSFAKSVPKELTGGVPLSLGDVPNPVYPLRLELYINPQSGFPVWVSEVPDPISEATRGKDAAFTWEITKLEVMRPPDHVFKHTASEPPRRAVSQSKPEPTPKQSATGTEKGIAAEIPEPPDGTVSQPRSESTAKQVASGTKPDTAKKTPELPRQVISQPKPEPTTKPLAGSAKQGSAAKAPERSGQAGPQSKAEPTQKPRTSTSKQGTPTEVPESPRKAVSQPKPEPTPKSLATGSKQGSAAKAPEPPRKAASQPRPERTPGKQVAMRPKRPRRPSRPPPGIWGKPPANVRASIAAITNAAPFTAKFHCLRWAYNTTESRGTITYQDDQHYRVEYESRAKKCSRAIRLERLRKFPLTQHVVVRSGDDCWHQMTMRNGEIIVEKLKPDWRGLAIKQGHLLFDPRAPIGPQLKYLIANSMRWTTVTEQQPDGSSFEKHKTSFDPGEFRHMERTERRREAYRSIREMRRGIEILLDVETHFPMRIFFWSASDSRSISFSLSDLRTGVQVSEADFTYTPPLDVHVETGGVEPRRW